MTPDYLNPELPVHLFDEEKHTTSAEQELELRAEILRLYEKHALSLLRFTRSVCEDPEASADLVQEAFLEYFQIRRTEVKPENPQAWLYRRVTVLAKKILDSSRTERDAAKTMSEAGDAASITPESIYSKDEMLKLIETALSPRERQILLLRLEGMRYKEIAQILGISTGSVGAKLTRSVQKLQRLFGKPDLPEWLKL